MKVSVSRLSPVVSPDVVAALNAGKPVVALESTIISHGMPWPRNIETALRLEQEVRSQGATPATIAIIDGTIHAGLSQNQMEQLAVPGTNVLKCSRRDLPFVVAQGLTGATTVAATMIIADMIGIRVFATGGIGGVHRGGADSLDVSADLQELSRTSVAVVCAGAKSILDLELTLEYLETHGVPVIGHQTDTLPGFYFRHSKYPVDCRLDNAKDIARAIEVKWGLGLDGGVVVANPVPEAHAMDRDVVESAVAAAISELESKGIKGKDTTPFLLSRLVEITGGESLDSNIELVGNNARLAAQIARELSPGRTMSGTIKPENG